MKHMRLILIILLNILFLQITNAQWVQQTNGLPENWGTGWAIDASDSINFVFSAESLWMSRDSGENWNNISPTNEGFNIFNDIEILDSQHIWAITSTKIYASLDGGINWEIQFYDTSLTNYLNYIEMFDLNSGIAMGDAIDSENDPAVLLKTIDGGLTWHTMNDSAFGGVSGDGWRRLDFLNINVGYFYATGLNPSKLYKTVDGAQSWTEANYSGGLTSLHFFSEDLGLLYDISDKRIHRTVNGGETWEGFDITATGWGNDIEFLPGDPSKVWFTDGPSLFYSSDTGRTWVEQEIFDGDLGGRDIIFTDDNHGLILCDNGKIFYTNNNGGIVTDVKNSKKELLPTEFKLYQNYPNPFNPVTTIKYSVPNVMRNSVSQQNMRFGESQYNITLKVYDILGREIATLVNESKPTGNYEATFTASDLSSGVYYYTLKVGDLQESKKMILMK